MSQSSFELVRPLFRYCAWLIVQVADFFAPTISSLFADQDKLASDLFAFVQSGRKSSESFWSLLASNWIISKIKACIYFIWWQGYVRISSDRQGKSLIYQICLMIGKEVSSMENWFYLIQCSPYSPLPILLSPTKFNLFLRESACIRDGRTISRNFKI